MSDLFSELAQERTGEIKAAEKKWQAAAEGWKQQQRLDEAWARAIRSWDAESFLELGRLLTAHGQDKYLPAITKSRKRAKRDGDIFALAELFVLECLRLACNPETPPGEIAEKLAMVSELWPDGIQSEVHHVREFIRIRHEHGGELPKVKNPKPKPQPGRDNPEPKGVAPRNQWFLKQHEARGTETYGSPKTILETWNTMKTEQRAKICPHSPGKVTNDTVAKGIQTARKVRDGKSQKTKHKPLKKLPKKS